MSLSPTAAALTGCSRLIMAVASRRRGSTRLRSAGSGWRCSRRRQSPSRRDAACCASMRASLLKAPAPMRSRRLATPSDRASAQTTRWRQIIAPDGARRTAGPWQPCGSLPSARRRQGDAGSGSPVHAAQQRPSCNALSGGRMRPSPQETTRRRPPISGALAAAPAEHRYAACSSRLDRGASRSCAPWRPTTTGAGAEAVSARLQRARALPRPSRRSGCVSAHALPATEATLSSSSYGADARSAPATAQPRD